MGQHQANHLILHSLVALLAVATPLSWKLAVLSGINTWLGFVSNHRGCWVEMRTTGASGGPLGCMERVWAMEWAMESHSKDYWSFWWASWLAKDKHAIGLAVERTG